MKKIKHKRLFLSLMVIAGFLSILVIVNVASCKPFIYTFRWLCSLTKEQGYPGDSKESSENVEEITSVEIPVTGYPSAKATLFAPDGDAEGLPLIVYVHGGGWCSGAASAVEWYARLLSSNGYCVANVDYSLAPKYRYPASTIQLTETVNYLYEHAEDYGYDRNSIFIGGNSAGAHLSSQLGAIFTDEEYASSVGVEARAPSSCIRGLLLYNGVYDFTNLRQSKFPFVNYLAWAYTGYRSYGKCEKADELSTAKHITSNYPSVFITVGDTDPLEDQTKEFIAGLEENGVTYSSLLWTDTGAGLWHDYIYEQNTKEGKKAYQESLEFMASCLKG